MAKKKLNILIVYICIGEYYRLLPMFNEHICKFLPGVNKTILCLSQRYNSKLPVKQLDPYTVERYDYVDLVPWPIPLVLKFHYIYRFMLKYQSNYTHVVYFNANAKILDKPQIFWNTFMEHLNKYDLIDTFHMYLDPPYIATGFFCGKWQSMKEILSRCITYTNENYLIQQNTFPHWHDEGIFNELHQEFEKKYKVHSDRYIMISYHTFRTEPTVFVDCINKDSILPTVNHVNVNRKKLWC